MQRQATPQPRRFRRDPVGIVGNLSALMGETIDAEAATSPAERTDAPTDAEPQTDAETRLRAFKAAYRALQDADRETAALKLSKTLYFLLVSKFS